MVGLETLLYIKKRMTRLSIGQRIAASFALLIMPLALVATFILSQQVSLFRTIENQNQITYVKHELLIGHRDLLLFQQRLHRAITVEDSVKVATLLENFDAGTTLTDAARVGRQSAELATLQNQLNKTESLLDQIQAEVALGNWEAAQSMVAGELIVNYDEIGLAINEYVENFDQVGNVTANQTRFILTTFFGFIIVLFLILVVGLILTTSVAIPLGRLKDSLAKWHSGDFSHRIELWGNSELTELGAMMNETIDLVESGRSRVHDQLTDHSLSTPEILSDRIYGLETSLTIARTVTSISDLEILLPQVVELLRQRYNLYHVAIYLLDPKTDLLVLESGALINDKRTLPINEKSMPGWAAKHRRPGLSEDVLHDARYYLSSMLPKTRSELTLPLIIGRDLLGVLDLHSDVKDGFSRDSVLQFQSMADLIGMAIRNLRIIEGGRSRLHLADALKGVGEALTASVNLPDLLRLMINHTNKLVEFDGATVSLWNGKMLEVFAVSGEIAAKKGMKITPDPSDPDDIFMRVQEAAGPVAIDLPDAVDMNERWQSLFLDGSWLAVPFLNDTGMVGMVAFARHKINPFSAEDRAISATIANQSCLALENAHKERQIKRVRKQMEFELHSRTEAIQTAYAELEKLDQTKSRFVSIASHELRTPLTVIRGYGEILQKQADIAQNEYHARIVNGILKGVNRISEIVENLLDLTRIDYRTLEIRPEPIRLKDLINQIQVLIKDELETRKIRLIIDESTNRLPIIDGDLIGMRKIFEHLINNAIKYSPDGAKIIISGRSWMGSLPKQLSSGMPGQPLLIDLPDDGIHLMIRDSGIGIDVADLEVIFQKFFQLGEVDLHSTGKYDFQGGGPGLGLAIVRGIVKAHHGFVWAESVGYDEAKMPGSTFHIILPRRQMLHDQTVRFDIPPSVINGAKSRFNPKFVD